MSIQNQQEVKQFSPGPELDVKVAEARGDYYLYKVFDGEVWACLPETGDQEFICTKSPSTSISDAWELVEEMIKTKSDKIERIYFGLNEYTDGWKAEFDIYGPESRPLNPDFRVESDYCDTATHAICLAYLEVRQNTPHTPRTASKGE